jgi:hypothetical protein
MVFLISKANEGDFNKAYEIILEMFRDKIPVLISEDEHNWHFSLEQAIDPEWYVDSLLVGKVKEVFNLSLKDIANYYKIYQRKVCTIITMYHSWALLSVPNIIKRDFTTIIHIDDHTDLMSGFFKKDEHNSNQLIDTIWGFTINLNESNDIMNAIDRGIIGMGNFLTAYLLATPAGRFYHIKSLDSQNFEQKDYSLQLKEEQFILGEDKYVQINPHLSEERNENNWTYTLTEAIPKLLDKGRDENVWLDIDLDYFSNRFNKDSDWMKNEYYDPTLEKIIVDMEKLLDLIKQSTWVNNVTALTIAFSPGFFPSEYLQIADKHFIQPLTKLFK